MDTSGQTLLYLHAVSGDHGLDHRPHHVGIAEDRLAAGLLLCEVVHEFGSLGDGGRISSVWLLEQLGYLGQSFSSQLS